MIDPDDLLDAAEVADMLGLSRRTAVAVYRSRYDDFPAPAIVKGSCMLWLRTDVQAWLDGRGR